MSALKDTGVGITWPAKTCELRVCRLDSVTSEEVAVATAKGCKPADVSIGQPRVSPSGLSSVWVKCPVSAGRKVVV